MIKRFFSLNLITVAGIFYDSAATKEHVYVLTVKKEGKKLIIKERNEFETVNDLLQTSSKKVPLIIVADNKGVLNKKIDTSVEADVVWKKNIDFSSFYHTTVVNSGIEFISFCRKTQADELTALFSKAGFEIADVYTGPVAACFLHTAVNKDSIVSNNTRFIFNDGKFTDIEKDSAVVTQNYTIGETDLNSHNIALYGAAVNFFVKSDEISKSEVSNINTDEIIFKKAFNTLGAAMLIIMFTALLISYGFTQYYISKNSNLNQQNVYSSQTFDQIKKLEEERDQKLKIINDTGQLSEHFISYYAYSLSASVPAGINLSMLEVFPLSAEIKDEKKISIDSRQIFIEGSSVNEQKLNDWLATLKKMSWIKTFEIMSLKQEKNGDESFQIKVVII